MYDLEVRQVMICLACGKLHFLWCFCLNIDTTVPVLGVILHEIAACVAIYMRAQ